MHAKSLQSCPTLCDYSPLGSSVHGILQARILEWVAMPSSRGSSCIFCNSCIGRQILYCWAAREAPRCIRSSQNMKIILNSTKTLEWTNSTHYLVIWNCQYVKWNGQYHARIIRAEKKIPQRTPEKQEIKMWMGIVSEWIFPSLFLLSHMKQKVTVILGKVNTWEEGLRPWGAGPGGEGVMKRNHRYRFPWLS